MSEPTHSFLPPELMSWLAVINLVFTWVLGLLMWLRKPGTDAAAALAAHKAELAKTLDARESHVDGRLDEQGRALTVLQTTVEHLPSTDQLRENERLLAALDERTKIILNSLRRLEDHLRSHD